MKVESGFVDSKDPDLFWQEGVCAVHDRAGINGPDGFNARNLGVRVDAGVGAPGTDHVDFMIQELLKRHLKFPLNRSQLRLDLPAVKFRSVVCDRQLEVPHRIRL